MDPEDFAFLLKLKNEGRTKEQVAEVPLPQLLQRELTLLQAWEQRKEDKHRETAGIAAELKRHGTEREAALIDRITQLHNDTSLNLEEKQQLIKPLLAEQKSLFRERVPAGDASESDEDIGGVVSKSGKGLAELLVDVRTAKASGNDLFRTGDTEAAMTEYLRMTWLLQQGDADFNTEAVLPLGRCTCYAMLLLSRHYSGSRCEASTAATLMRPNKHG